MASTPGNRLALELNANLSCRHHMTFLVCFFVITAYFKYLYKQILHLDMITSVTDQHHFELIQIRIRIFF